MARTNFNVGDKVRLRLSLEELDGHILESSDKDIVLLKLGSGYNVGIKKEKILGSRILKKYDEGLEDDFKLPSRKDLKNVGMIVTGGTIASKLDPKTGAVKHLVSLEEFAKFYPKLFEKVNVSKVEMPFMIASESMDSEHWTKIAESVEKMLNDPEIEGIIITHGTDFLHYTAAALSFFLGDLGKPVVLTYAQRSIDRASSDADLNLVCAAEMALSDCAEVIVVGHGSVNDDFCYAHKGTKVKKMHTSRRDAFQSVNDMPLARIVPGNVEFLGDYKKRDNSKKTQVDSRFSDKVALIKFYPGQDPGILDYYAMKCKGIILEVSGLGHLPVSESKSSWVPKIRKLIKEGCVVCAASQTIYGRLNPKVYSNGRELEETGVVFLEDMLSETALVKLGWVLGHHGWKKKSGEKMLENISGELNKNLGLDSVGIK